MHKLIGRKDEASVDLSPSGSANDRAAVRQKAYFYPAIRAGDKNGLTVKG